MRKNAPVHIIDLRKLPSQTQLSVYSLCFVLYIYFPIVNVAELRYGSVHEDRESLSFIVDLVFEQSLVNDFSANAAYMY